MVFKGHGIVWSREHNKPLCSFSNAGKFETDDLGTAQKLIDMGYEYEGDISELEQEVSEEPEQQEPEQAVPEESEVGENSQEKKATSRRGRKND